MMRARPRVVAALALAATLSVAGLPVASAATSAGPRSGDGDSVVGPAASLQNASCRSARRAVAMFPAERSRIDEGIVTLGEWTVDFDEAGWQVDHPRINLLTRAFHSSAWLIPERVADVGESIALFAEQAQVNPDPGATMTARQLRERGWTEGHTTWRLKTALCLYRLADAEQQAMLMPAIDQLLAANLDPQRYYGPPLKPAHNHGLMADRELLNAARLLNRPDLAEAAVERLDLQKTQLYDECGLNNEQATSYQFLHASIWNQLLRRIDIPRFAARIESTVQTITDATSNLTFPDGSVPAIGDGTHRNIDDLSLVSDQIRMWCPETGWSSRRTSRGDVTQQLITRFGPATGFHGHSDKGGFVWWVGSGSVGVPVIADRGTPPKTKPQLLDRVRSASNHAVFDWRGVSDKPTTALTTTSRGRETITISSRSSRNANWTRSIRFTPNKSVLRVADQVSMSDAPGPARSYLPLDPVWQRTNNPFIFRTDSGWSLRVNCTDSSGDRLPMRTNDSIDYQQDTERPAIGVTCAARDASRGVVATLQVTPPLRRP